MDTACLIIGAGPAGLFCAARLGESGMKPGNVRILDSNETPGKKLLLSGSGQCNFTHEGSVEDFLSAYGSVEAGRFLRKALYAFSNHDAMEFFRSRGLPSIVREDGKVFPGTMDARDIVRVLFDKARDGGIQFSPGTTVLDVQRGDNSQFRFTVRTQETVHRCRFLVLATGGKSYPVTGSRGDGYRIAEALGHTVVPAHPALAPLIVKNYTLPDLAGVSLENISAVLRKNNKKHSERSGDVVFTHTGLSGPVIQNLSRYADSGDILTLDLSRTGDMERSRSALFEYIRNNPASSVREAVKSMSGLSAENGISGIPRRLLTVIFNDAGLSGNERCGNVKKNAVNLLISLLTGFPFIIDSTGGFTTAMATAGGVALPEVNSATMESRIVQGLYFAGEVLDVDGDSGGYNIQAAFSTADRAARSILDSLQS